MRVLLRRPSRHRIEIIVSFHHFIYSSSGASTRDSSIYILPSHSFARTFFFAFLSFCLVHFRFGKTKHNAGKYVDFVELSSVSFGINVLQAHFQVFYLYLLFKWILCSHWNDDNAHWHDNVHIIVYTVHDDAVVTSMF